MGYNYSTKLRNACSGITIDGPSKDRCKPSVLWMMLLHPMYNCRIDLTTMKSTYSSNCIYNTRPLYCFMYELFSLSLIVGINLLCTSWMLLTNSHIQTVPQSIIPGTFSSVSAALVLLASADNSYIALQELRSMIWLAYSKLCYVFLKCIIKAGFSVWGHLMALP